MTDPKQSGAKGAAASSAKDDDKKVFIRNNTKTPYVVPASGVGPSTTIRPDRVTPVNAEAWAAFQKTPFGQSLAEAQAVEESTEDEHASQPKSEQEQAAEDDAAADEAARTRTKKSRK